MAENSKIEWTDHTFNPWWGCQKVSPACDHCYAERDAKRFAAGQVLWGVDSERRTFGDKHWSAPRRWNEAARKNGVRSRVFCASMGDWLDLDAPLDEFVRLLDLVRTTPELDWLLLSKRIGNWSKRTAQAYARVVETEGSDAELAAWIYDWLNGRPPANVWIGSTIINQEEANRDIPKLLQVPARVRFLSIEPMLGPIYLEDIPDPSGGVCLKPLAGLRWIANGQGRCEVQALQARVDWVICGGESGPGARPMHPDWARSLRDQCKAAGVPFLMKQWGEWLGQHQDGNPDHQPMELNATDHPIKVGKKAAGRLLDGMQHDGFPGVA